MKRTNSIALDVHSTFCEGGYIDDTGREKSAWHEPTSIPELAKVIEAVSRPRKLVIEEGPLADWLYRNLLPRVDEIVVCDPHRNALISKDGDKSDALDWRKLASLYRGGFVKAVHHPASLERSLFKQHVQLYHDRVNHRVSEAQKIIWRVRRLGVFIKHKDLTDDELRKEMIGKLPSDGRRHLWRSIRRQKRSVTRSLSGMPYPPKPAEGRLRLTEERPRSEPK